MSVDEVFRLGSSKKEALMSHRVRTLILSAGLTGFLASAAFAGDPKPQAETPPPAQADRSPEDVFASMRKAFRADRASGVHFRYQFRFHDPQGGNWWIIVKDGACSMGKGVIEKPDVTFSCTGSDWVGLSKGELGGLRAYLTGRLRVAGPQGIARKLDDLFRKGFQARDSLFIFQKNSQEAPEMRRSIVDTICSGAINLSACSLARFSSRTRRSMR